MRAIGMMLLLGVVACSASIVGRGTPTADRGPREHVGDGPFAGVWEACDGGASSPECSRYWLFQRGQRICGAWSYVASGRIYEGRLIARADSEHEATRTRVCGRRGSETSTECEVGWEPIDKPLLLCEGRLTDVASRGGACRADYRPAADVDGGLGALAREPWLQSCLAGDGSGDGP